MFNRLQDLIDRIPSGLRRVLIAVIVLALLAVFFPLQQDVNRLNQPLPPLTPTPAPVNDSAGGGDAINTSTSGAEAGSSTATDSESGDNSNTSEPDGAAGSSSNSSSDESSNPAPSATPRSTATTSPTVMSRSTATTPPTATLRSTATPRPTLLPCGPEEGWVIYTVRPGDTLNAIARLVGASIEELVECNDLTNPNALRVNQQLFVPGLPSLFVTSTATPSITPTPSLTPTPRA